MCICSDIQSVDNPFPLVIVQHPSEATHPMGTARILELSLSQCAKVVTNQPDNSPELLHWLHSKEYQCYLLYPSDDAETISSDFIRHHDSEARKPAFVLLDATWRKAYGLLASSSALQALPKVSFSTTFNSRYRVRATSIKGGLSTVEAAAYLFSELEGKPCEQTGYYSLLTCLDKMVAAQMGRMPESVISRYRDHSS